jgi:ubiquinone/menaquinone biosynthesis C-methylase UbiE
MVLKPSDVRAYYDRFGKKQDSQKFYEDPALADLVAHTAFENAARVIEFGCGTGRFAEKLLREHLPTTATYVGCDLSRTMVDLATARLAKYSNRSSVVLSENGVHLPLADNSVDSVISTYVLDLLSESDIKELLNEASRVLDIDGRLCLVSLTRGPTMLSRTVSGLWNTVFRLHASLVGGCRPIRLENYLAPDRWEITYRNVVVAYGVPSEVLVALVRKS